MFDQTRREWLQTLAGSLATLALPGCRRAAPPSPDAFDVCIVGSGPAGAILAHTLANRGIRTLLLEGGPNPTRRAQDLPDGFMNLQSLSGPFAYPVDNTRFLGDGGTSNLWGGECPRLQPADFEPGNPYAPAGAAWPITYEEIEPYYQKAEEELSIAGGSQNQYSPPRSSDFSLHLAPELDAQCLQEFLGAKDWSLEPTPRSRVPKVSESHLPRLANLPSVTFRRHVRVTAVRIEPGGRVSHLEARSANGQPEQITAKFYVLACGGIETPRLLLYSRSPTFPRGIGNAHDHVGRFFMEHLAIEVGTFTLPAAASCRDEEAISWQLSREFRRLGLGQTLFEFSLRPPTIRLSAILEMKPSASNRVLLSTVDTDSYGDPAADVMLSIAESEHKTWEHAMSFGHPIAEALGGQDLMLAKGKFRWTHHHMGTCRMGSDPRTSVVDPNLKVHDAENLYVSGSAPFVTCGAGSPTLLMTSLTLRLADHLEARVTGQAAYAARTGAAGLTTRGA